MTQRKAPKTAWRPGQSGNPAGRPPRATLDVLEAYGAHADEVLARTLEIMRDAKTPPHVVLKACEMIADRIYGRPVQQTQTELTGRDGDPLFDPNAAREKLKQHIMQFLTEASKELKK